MNTSGFLHPSIRKPQSGSVFNRLVIQTVLNYSEKEYLHTLGEKKKSAFSFSAQSALVRKTLQVLRRGRGRGKYLLYC